MHFVAALLDGRRIACITSRCGVCHYSATHIIRVAAHGSVSVGSLLTSISSGWTATKKAIWTQWRQWHCYESLMTNNWAKCVSSATSISLCPLLTLLGLTFHWTGDAILEIPFKNSGEVSTTGNAEGCDLIGLYERSCSLLSLLTSSRTHFLLARIRQNRKLVVHKTYEQ